ncbi:MAG: ABC transporter ATP-binding protein/permease [Treponema sp.]|nr:ABC transporter ATP-binding protein/permease [Treponema sp.]
MKNKGPVLQVVKYMLKTAKENKPILFFAYFLQLLATLLQKVQIIIVPKFLIDELISIYNGQELSFHVKNAIIFAILAIGIQFIVNVINSLVSRIKSLCDEWFSEYFQVKVNDYAMALDFEHTEDPQALNQLNKAKEGVSWYSGNVCGILNQFFDIITNVIVFFGVIAIIAGSAPLIIPVQIVVIILVTIFQSKIRQIELKSFEGLSKINRIINYIFYQLAEFQYGKDIRLYDSSKLFMETGEKHLDQQIKIWKYQAEGSKKQQYCINLVSAAENFLVYFYLGYQALKKLISIGQFSMCISASSNLTNSCENLIRCFQEIIKRSKYAQEYLKFIEYPQAVQKGNKKIKNQDQHIIEFRHVYFKYPRSQEYVLKDINITIPSGQHLAVVGLNGAGKTTFIKLLCRLYDVSQGQILVDGINIKEYSDEEYRKLFAVLFQDFKIFAFSLKENIAFGQEASDEELERVLKLAGLYEYAQSLPQKTDTCVNKSFDKGGTEFSGGQKQKLAIARALYKDSPIIILDEPTAALDPIAEADIYARFNNSLAGGKTAIYISHRLSSCIFCDKIAVFSNNQIKEYGSHKDLMKIEDGLYQQMFTTQAKQYLPKD